MLLLNKGATGTTTLITVPLGADPDQRSREGVSLRLPCRAGS